jgi:hypothetical protein
MDHSPHWVVLVIRRTIDHERAEVPVAEFADFVWKIAHLDDDDQRRWIRTAALRSIVPGARIFPYLPDLDSRRVAPDGLVA